MSLTHQIITPILKQRFCSRAKACTSVALHFGSRGIHSLRLTPVKLSKSSSRKLCNNLLLENWKAGGNILLHGRNTTSFFIISRDESTTSIAVQTEAVQASTKQSPVVEQITSHSTLESAKVDVGSALVSENVQVVEASTSKSADTLSSGSEALVFESIPEPPAVPVPVEDVVGAIVGEPSLASLGLAGWSPSGIVQQSLEFFHVSLGMPWWASILTGTVIVRLLLFPLVVKSQRNAAKMQNNMPELQVLQAKMTEARQTGNALLSAKYGQEMMLFMKQKDISPFKQLLMPLAMAPIFISFFFGIRKMANLPVESFRDGGLFWFTDLTIADPYYLLPMITSLTVLATLEIGADGMRLNSQQSQLIKYFMRGIPLIMFPFTMNFPAAILCYWVSTNAISLVQVSVLKLPAVRAKLNIEPARKITPDMVPVKKKGFRESLKESWTNMKISKEIEDRQRYDEISFKRAGRGPIPKTYKYDPTKVNPLQEAAKAVQAKRK